MLFSAMCVLNFGALYIFGALFSLSQMSQLMMNEVPHTQVVGLLKEASSDVVT